MCLSVSLSVSLTHTLSLPSLPPPTSLSHTHSLPLFSQPVLFTLCSANELFFMALYFAHFGIGQQGFFLYFARVSSSKLPSFATPALSSPLIRSSFSLCFPSPNSTSPTFLCSGSAWRVHVFVALDRVCLVSTVCDQALC